MNRDKQRGKNEERSMAICLERKKIKTQARVIRQPSDDPEMLRSRSATPYLKLEPLGPPPDIDAEAKVPLH
jgi:hypothetical protein